MPLHPVLIDEPRRLSGGKMEIYHSTSDAGKEGIEREGFNRSCVDDTPNANWFTRTRDPHVTTAFRDWWVIVDIPEEVVADYAAREIEHIGFTLPHDVVNRYERRYERWTNEEKKSLENPYPDGIWVPAVSDQPPGGG